MKCPQLADVCRLEDLGYSIDDMQNAKVAKHILFILSLPHLGLIICRKLEKRIQHGTEIYNLLQDILGRLNIPLDNGLRSWLLYT